MVWQNLACHCDVVNGSRKELMGSGFSYRASASSLKLPSVFHTELKPRRFRIFSKQSFFYAQGM